MKKLNDVSGSERVLDSAALNNAVIEIVERTDLTGASSPAMCRGLYYMNKAGASVKFVRITMDGSVKLTTEAGALYYHYGDIKCSVNAANGGIGGFITRQIRSAVTSESAVTPEYFGVGTVVLEPTFRHFAIVQLNGNSVIVDKGMFYCCIGEIRVEAAMQSDIVTGLLGGEGLFQTKLTGAGYVVLESPVPMSEIEMYYLENERMQVDGNFAILRDSSIAFTVQKSANGIIDTLASGEGLLNTFEGTGQVWIAPTAPVYRRVEKSIESNTNILSSLGGKSRNNTQ